jgi:N-acetylglucosamine kinase-like BadF-type ATPase
MSIIVGVDAGGTATDVIAERDNGSRVAAKGEPVNVRATGIDIAADRIVATVEKAIRSIPDAIVVGAAGAGADVLRAALRAALQVRLPGARIAIEDDAEIALRAGARTGDGLVLVAGTGSIAYARIGDVRLRSGGYGYLIGDDGSGYALGVAATKALLRHYDGRGPREPWFDALERAIDARGTLPVLAAFYDSREPVRRIAALAPIVLEAAGAGERAATKIVQAAALGLFEMLATLLQRAEAEDRELPLVFSGGLFSGNSPLTYLVETRVSNEYPDLIPVKNAPPPAAGALELARGLLKTK